MKKSLIAFAALSAVAGFAHAEDGVQLYGILDAGVAYQNHSQSGSDTFPVTLNNNFPAALPQAANHSFTGIVNGPMSDSRWGIKGSEDLGGGLSAHFDLESGINLPTGQLNNAANSLIQNANAAGNVPAGVNSSLSGQLFSRMAFVGLSSREWGTLDIGRNTTPGYEVIGAYDPQQGSQLFSPLGFSGSEGGALGYTEVLRNDNSIKYSKVFTGGALNGVNVRAIYKFSNQAGYTAAGNGGQINVGYENARFGGQLVVSKYNDVAATAGATIGPTNLYQGIKASLYNTDGIAVALKYKATNDWTVKAGYQFYERTAPSISAVSIGSLSEFGYTFSYPAGNLTDGTTGDKPLQYGLGWIGAEWQLKPNQQLRFAWYNILQHSQYTATTPDETDNQFSVVYDYYLSKRTDVYSGLMYQVYNGVPSQNNFNTIVTYAVGMRHKF